MNGNETHGGMVLIVDDNEGLRETLREILTLWGYRVATAANEAEALACLSIYESPRLVLLGLGSRPAGTYGHAADLREDPRLAGVPVVPMLGREDLRSEITRSQAWGYLHKPISVRDLLTVVERHCSVVSARVH
jgi:DNA-binding NtrC family response regulator